MLFISARKKQKKNKTLRRDEPSSFGRIILKHRLRYDYELYDFIRQRFFTIVKKLQCQQKTPKERTAGEEKTARNRTVKEGAATGKNVHKEEIAGSKTVHEIDAARKKTARKTVDVWIRNN